jgi:hypothetical protein
VLIDDIHREISEEKAAGIDVDRNLRRLFIELKSIYTD